MEMTLVDSRHSRDRNSLDEVVMYEDIVEECHRFV